MFAEDVTDARAVTRPHRRQIDRLLGMHDDDRRVVLDVRSHIDCANQIVDLLTGRPGQAQTLVESADPLEDVSPQEDRERDRAVPEVVACEPRRVALPGCGGRRTARDAVDTSIGETRGDALEQVGGERAVVVRKRDDVGTEQRQGGIARARKPPRSPEALDRERGVRLEDRLRALVVVLIDHEHPKLLVRLNVERCEQPLELRGAADGRDDEVESHGLTLTPVPLVSVLLSVRNDARFVGEAASSILAQTLDDLELIVVDDASTDDTPGVLAALDDGRVVVLRNEEQLGLAASLNRGLDHATGRYVARLDADDVSLPDRLARQIARIRAEPSIAVLGTAVTDLDEHGRPGRTHAMPVGARPLRWHALFSSPFFHPTVLVDRELLDAHGLRYDPAFLESEDYDLWARLFAYADGDNLREPLVRKRVHEGQASLARFDLQESFQRRVALREIRRLAPGVDADRAWRVGARKQPPRGSSREFLRLLAAFEREHGRSRAVRAAVLRALVGSRRSRR